MIETVAAYIALIDFASRVIGFTWRKRRAYARALARLTSKTPETPEQAKDRFYTDLKRSLGTQAALELTTELESLQPFF